MRKRNVDATNEHRLVDTPQFCAYLSVGRNSAIRWGTENGCKVKIGNRTLWDITAADRALDKLNA